MSVSIHLTAQFVAPEHFHDFVERPTIAVQSENLSQNRQSNVTIFIFHKNAPGLQVEYSQVSSSMSD